MDGALQLTCAFSSAATLKIDLPGLLEDLDMSAAQMQALQLILQAKQAKQQAGGRRRVSPALLQGAELAAVLQQRAAMPLPRPAPLTEYVDAAEARVRAGQACRDQRLRQQDDDHEEE